MACRESAVRVRFAPYKLLPKLRNNFENYITLIIYNLFHSDKTYILFNVCCIKFAGVHNSAGFINLPFI